LQQVILNSDSLILNARAVKKYSKLTIFGSVGKLSPVN
jgi:hypothetical protein